MLEPHVLVLNDEYLPAGEQLAADLRVPLQRQVAEGATYILVHDDGLSFLSHLTKPHLKLHLDFLRGRIAYRLRQSSSEPIIKAFQDVPKTEYIFDATLGFAEDSVRLASHGHNVVATEKNRFVYLLVKDAIDRAEIKNIELWQCSAEKKLSELDKKPYAIYLDPMFKIEKSAKTKKEMQVLQLLTDTTGDSEGLFLLALETALQKVVVKRAIEAKPISDRPHQSIVSKTIRFDIYRK